MKKETLLASEAWMTRDTSKAHTINPPLYKGSTVLFKDYNEMVSARERGYEGITYGTDRLPTQRQFEEAMRTLEGASATRLFQSGIAAIQTTLMAFTKAGDHLLLTDNAYGPGQHFIKKVLTRFGVEHDVVPPTIGQDIEQFMKANTSLILLESPGSITFELQDIPAVTEVARQRGIVTVLDATWATPLYIKPFNLGVDVSLHSVTKYISGYSDVLAGSVSVHEKYSEQFRTFYKQMEIYTPGEESYLALRGLHSLAPRLRQHEQSALTIAKWLQKNELVKDVLHPALSSHPENRIWQRDFQGSSGLFGFTFKKDYEHEKLCAFIDALELFGLGYSWGGFKSLLTASKVRRKTECRYDGQTIIRLNIGLEECSDLLEDLEKGLSVLI